MFLRGVLFGVCVSNRFYRGALGFADARAAYTVGPHATHCLCTYGFRIRARRFYCGTRHLQKAEKSAPSAERKRIGMRLPPSEGSASRCVGTLGFPVGHTNVLLFGIRRKALLFCAFARRGYSLPVSTSFFIAVSVNSANVNPQTEQNKEMLHQEMP